MFVCRDVDAVYDWLEGGVPECWRRSMAHIKELERRNFDAQFDVALHEQQLNHIYHYIHYIYIFTIALTKPPI